MFPANTCPSQACPALPNSALPCPDCPFISLDCSTQLQLEIPFYAGSVQPYMLHDLIDDSMKCHVRCSNMQCPCLAGLMNAVTAVEWPITFEFSEDSKYNTLLQISVGQEEVDEIIGRDINRTFPEHPQFGFEQGQQALYRVLKAYSLHDLEVGYCQVRLLLRTLLDMPCIGRTTAMHHSLTTLQASHTKVSGSLSDS